MMPAITALTLTLILTAAPTTEPPQAASPPATRPQITFPPIALPDDVPPPQPVAPPQALSPQKQEITHDAAVEIVARATAAELVTSANCKDILFNQSLLDQLSDRFKVGDADHTAIDKEVRASIVRLKDVLKQTRNKQDWCDAMLQLYGPEGTFVPHLMKR